MSRHKIAIRVVLVFMLTAAAFLTGLSFSSVEYMRGSNMIITIGHTNIVYAAEVPDYTADSIDDDVQFQAALDALPSIGGEVRILSGNYSLSTAVTRTISNVTWSGVGQAVTLNRNDSDPTITAGGNNWVFRNFSTDAGGVSVGATTGWMKVALLEGTTYTEFASETLISNQVALIGADNQLTGIANLSIANGGTGATDAATALSNLGGIGVTTTDTLTNKLLDDFTNDIHADNIHIQVRNESGSGMTLGQVVYISGYSIGQDLPLVSLADSNGVSTFPSIGLVADATIANNTSGQISVSGRMSSLDTSSFSAGDTVYLSMTPGELSVRPTANTSKVQSLGIVLRSHATLGVLQIAGAYRVNDIPNTVLDDRFRIADVADDTKLVRFDAGSITSATEHTVTLQDVSGTMALQSDKLSVFATTTSSELASVVSDETGGGVLVFGTNPSLAGLTLTGNLDANGQYLTSLNSLFMSEQVAADADIAAEGQLWVKNETPNILVFTDDTGVDQVIGGVAYIKSYSLSNPGTAGTFYVGGYYNFSATSATLTIGGTVTQTFGSSSQAHGAHVFAVASGAGGTDLVLTVSGVSINDSGARDDTDSEIIVADTDAATTDQYFETSKKWLGQVTYTLTGSSGSFTFNYGLTKYDDFGNRPFTITDFEATGEMRANETALNIELLHHESINFVYNASAFVPNQTALISLSTDYGTNNDVASGDSFAYKRSALSHAVAGAGGEGVIIRVTTVTNNSVNDASFHIGVVLN